MELVLPEAAELDEIPGELLAPKLLPDLWSGEEISAQSVMDYFNGQRVVQVDRGGFTEPVPVPKASADVVNAAVNEAVTSRQGMAALRTGEPAGRTDPDGRADARRQAACAPDADLGCIDPAGEPADGLAGGRNHGTRHCHWTFAAGRRHAAMEDHPRRDRRRNPGPFHGSGRGFLDPGRAICQARRP